MSDFTLAEAIAKGVSRRRFIFGATALAAASVVIAGCSSSGATASGSGEAGGQSGSNANKDDGGAKGPEAEVTMNDALQFVPAEITVAKGTTIEFKNTSASPHTVTCDESKAVNKANSVLPPGAKPFDSGNMNPGDKFKHTFDVAGDYVYFCIPHETVGMVAKVKVTE